MRLFDTPWCVSTTGALMKTFFSLANALKFLEQYPSRDLYRFDYDKKEWVLFKKGKVFNYYE